MGTGLLLAVYGLGLIGAGIFPADPAAGFPPGTPEATTLSGSGLLHFVFGGLGFYALIGACFVFTRKFLMERRRGWALYSAFTGVFFLASFGAVASGSTAAAVMLTFYLAVAWVWVWHSGLSLTLLRQSEAIELERGPMEAAVAGASYRSDRP